MVNLTGKIALVSGAGQGIGKGCALELARCGADLVVNDRPDDENVLTTAAEIRSLGRTCTVVHADVFTREGRKDLVENAVTTAGRLDILISNPARSIRAEFLAMDLDDFESVISGTLTSGFHLSQLAARQMVSQGDGGKIVFISSVQARMPIARSVAYNAAKAGLNHMAETMAAELCDHRINVNVIEPGWIETPGEHATFGSDAIQAAAAGLPWGRLGKPTDIGKAAAFLASDQADYVTGSIMRVDGGFWFKDCRPSQVISPRGS